MLLEFVNNQEARGLPGIIMSPAREAKVAGQEYGEMGLSPGSLSAVTSCTLRALSAEILSPTQPSPSGLR